MSTSADRFGELWSAVRIAYERLAGAKKIIHSSKSRNHYQKLTLNHEQMHYEWCSLFREHVLRICLDIEGDDEDTNHRLAALIFAHRESIERNLRAEIFHVAHLKGRCDRIFTVLPIKYSWPDNDEIEAAAKLMVDFIQASRAFIPALNER